MMQSKANELLTIAQRIRALNETALVYSHNDYEIDRSKELIAISERITAMVTGLKEEEISACYSPVKEYVTPKVDVRAVVFNDKDEVLLVREKADGRWSLPGGWSDVGFTPKEVVLKEVKEETGFSVRIVKLLAVFDKRCWNHPASPFYIYKMCFLCDIVGAGADDLTFDILDRGFFPLNNLPELSRDRTLPEQILLLDELRRNPQAEVYCD
ncbi:MAG: NUDIX hydrolase N-terminal domain-containing protein [Tannerella sp.]|jgi:ADP-ribose pyrophosphatase YjhB (NUDIX family)|nr:NUDIX hydrolase N-terminal domain-containing protein [Tannerella sp.]